MRGERERERGVSGREWSDISPGPGPGHAVMQSQLSQQRSSYISTTVEDDQYLR